MKTTKWVSLFVLCLSTAAYGVDKAELDDRIRSLTAKFTDMQQKTDKRVPAETLKKARGIILLDRTKAGFIFAYQGGSGVAMVRDPKTDKWGAPLFLAGKEASLGLQVGGEQSFFVILMMNTNATRMLTEANYDFGGEASGTAGNESSGVSGTVNKDEKSVLVYDDKEGLFGGAAVKGSAVSPDKDANKAYYGQTMAATDILFHSKEKPSPAIEDLVKKINDYSKK
jgi:lipid-binding SYLF domain-containing protein